MGSGLEATGEDLGRDGVHQAGAHPIGHPSRPLRSLHPKACELPGHRWAPFFEETYADNLVEYNVEHLRRDAAHPAEPVHAEFDPSRIIVTVEDVEVSLLWRWQMVCGMCDRLDLINNSTVRNWRSRFAELDKWFQTNRPYILWDKKSSCIQIDQEAKEFGFPTPRKPRKIPSLSHPGPRRWQSRIALG